MDDEQSHLNEATNQRKPSELGSESILLYKTPTKTDTTGPLSSISLEILLKRSEDSLAKAQVLSTESCADDMVSRIVLIYREDILKQEGEQDMGLAGLIAALYRAAEMSTYSSIFFTHIENLKGNLCKYNLQNRNIIEFLIGFVLFTKSWKHKELGKALEWLQYSQCALKSVGSNAWWSDLCHLSARWEHGLAICSDRKKYADHLANEYIYYERARQHCLRFKEDQSKSISYKIIMCTAKMIQLHLDLPVHHKRFPFKREFALEQIRFCTIRVHELARAYSLQQQLIEEAQVCKDHGNEIRFYIKFGDVYLLLRELQLVALGDYFRDTEETCRIPQGWNRARWLTGTKMPETNLQEISYLMYTAIGMCDQLLKDDAFTASRQYKDVLSFIKDAIKPYLQYFDPKRLYFLSKGNSKGCSSDSSDEEINVAIPNSRRVLQNHYSSDSKSSI